MKIAVVGTGSIGSTFALHLARAGHDVTVVARGKRLEQLQRDGAIVTTAGERATVTVSAALDPTTEWDLVLVTVFASQVDAVLPAVRASAARRVMFMFNTFESLDRLRDAVGAERFTFGFPAILATITDGALEAEVLTVAQITTVTDPTWADVFTRAGIRTKVTDDMQSWLRTHAAMVVPLMVAAARVHGAGAGLSWAESRQLARAMNESFELVRSLGHPIIPRSMAALSRVPAFAVTFAIWSASRTSMMADLGAMGTGEARTLIDAMSAAAPERSEVLRSIRP